MKREMDIIGKASKWVKFRNLRQAKEMAVLTMMSSFIPATPEYDGATGDHTKIRAFVEDIF